MWQGSLRCEQPCRQVSGWVVREATATRSWRLSAVTLWWVPLVWQERRTAAGLQLRDRLAWADGWFVCALAVFSSLLILDPNTQVTWAIRLERCFSGGLMSNLYGMCMLHSSLEVYRVELANSLSSTQSWKYSLIYFFFFWKTILTFFFTLPMISKGNERLPCCLFSSEIVCIREPQSWYPVLSGNWLQTGVLAFEASPAVNPLVVCAFACDILFTWVSSRQQQQ